MIQWKYDPVKAFDSGNRDERPCVAPSRRMGTLSLEGVVWRRLGCLNVSEIGYPSHLYLIIVLPGRLLELEAAKRKGAELAGLGPGLTPS